MSEHSPNDLSCIRFIVQEHLVFDVAEHNPPPRGERVALRLKKMEQVPCEDTELILSVLEDRLRTLTHDVVREGERITMFGLGPSPRAINPRDTTVIDVRASNGVTTIDADVSFQASSFVADMPQDTIVLGKLERVFEEMKAEVDYKVRGS